MASLMESVTGLQEVPAVNQVTWTAKLMELLDPTSDAHILYITVQQIKDVHLLGIHMGALKHLMINVQSMLSMERLYTDAGLVSVRQQGCHMQNSPLKLDAELAVRKFCQSHLRLVGKQPEYAHWLG